MNVLQRLKRRLLAVLDNSRGDGRTDARQRLQLFAARGVDGYKRGLRWIRQRDHDQIVGAQFGHQGDAGEIGVFMQATRFLNRVFDGRARWQFVCPWILDSSFDFNADVARARSFQPDRFIAAGQRVAEHEQQQKG